MIKLKYKKKTEKIPDLDDELIKTSIIEITAKTDTPNTQITFNMNNKHLATTMTDNTGIAVCAISDTDEEIIITAYTNNNESEPLEVNI